MESGKITNQQITASSYWGSSILFTNCQPINGRLNQGFPKGWCAASATVGQWLQVDFGAIKTVTKIATQGRFTSNRWNQYVKQYKLAYYCDGTATWIEYKRTDSSAVEVWIVLIYHI